MVTESCVGLLNLVQRNGGLFNGTRLARAEGTEPALLVRVVEGIGTSSAYKDGQDSPFRRRFSGAAAAITDQEALFLAVAEGLERYCAITMDKDQAVVASATELGNAALDLDLIPRCSDVELENPRCDLVKPDKNQPIRWVQGLSLLTGRVTYIPVVMAYLNVGYSCHAERFWHPISTGCAGHTSYERAVAAAVLEVVERDAISTLWLQKLPLPRVEVDTLREPLLAYWDQYRRSSLDLEYLFFDATLDLGFPTVYGLQIARHHQRLTTLVSCSTDLDPAKAITRVMREMAALRVALRVPHAGPSSIDDFRGVLDGAAYMAQAQHCDSFAFLLQSGRIRPLSNMPILDQGSDESNLRFILGRLAEKRLEAYAVDLTTDEALRIGVRVVRVLVPGLQPVSFHHRARYLGHRRLYEVPATMGYRVLPEDNLNKDPQPFA